MPFSYLSPICHPCNFGHICHYCQIMIVSIFCHCHHQLSWLSASSPRHLQEWLLVNISHSQKNWPFFAVIIISVTNYHVRHDAFWSSSKKVWLISLVWLTILNLSLLSQKVSKKLCIPWGWPPHFKNCPTLYFHCFIDKTIITIKRKVYSPHGDIHMNVLNLLQNPYRKYSESHEISHWIYIT